MKITVELNLTYSQARVLNDWASICRTLKQSERLLYDCRPTDDEHKAEQVNANLDELDEVIYPLDAIHQQIRSALWQLTGGVGKHEKLS